MIPYHVSNESDHEESLDVKKKGIYFLTVPSIPHPHDAIQTPQIDTNHPDAIDLRSQIESPYDSKHPRWQTYPTNVEIISRQIECVALQADQWKGRVSRKFWIELSDTNLSSIRDIYDTIRKHGMIPESMEHKIAIPATRVAARPFRLLNVKLLPRNVKVWESFLASGCPIAVSLAIYNDPNQMPPIYEFPEQNQKIQMVLPALVVGYDSKRDIFIVQGPFTKDWGEEGFIALPYEYVQSHSVVLEMWVARFSKHIQKSTDIDFDTISFDVSK